MIKPKKEYNSQILVCGTINVDFITYVDRMPLMGETLTSERYYTSPGGKALNQAIAASRMKADTKLIGKIGDDFYKNYLMNAIEKERIETTGLLIEEDLMTGNSFVIVDGDGNNSIITNLNVNKSFRESEIDLMFSNLKNVEIVLLQLEMNYEIREFILQELHKSNVKIVLNLAPVVSISKKSLSYVDVLIINQIEAEQILDTSLTSIKHVIEHISDLQLVEKQKVIVTLGSKGCVVLDDKEIYHIDAPNVSVINTSGAGDCFCGTFVAKWLDYEFLDAVDYAIHASALSVTKSGTLESLPNDKELNEFLTNIKKG